MSVFSQINRTEVAEFLRGYECGELINFNGIHQGVTNSNFELLTSKGSYILTLYEQHDKNTLLQLHQLQHHLKSNGLKSASIIKNKKYQFSSMLVNKPAAIFEKINGIIDYTITPDLCQQVGLLLASFHLTPGLEFFERRNPRGFDWMFNTAESLMSQIDKNEQLILQQELAFLSRFSELALPAGAIHADLFPDNALVINNQITGIIDFDFACHEVYIFDICICINAWCSKANGELDRLRMRDLLAAYTSLRPLNQDENLAIPMMLRATALRFWLSRLDDILKEHDEDQVQFKNPDEFKNILMARRHRLSGMQR
jgi:homoserine kinase type II